jgi:hypothetical protein
MEPLEAHEQLFGKKSPPTERQMAFYAMPTARGFSSKEMDPEITDAALIRALAQVVDKGVPAYHQTFLFFPEEARPWVVSRIHNLATMTMSRMAPVLKDERGRKAIAHVRKWLEVIQLGAVKGWTNPKPPDRWAAFGYSKEDDVPEWLKEALV